jgi:CheY-like chemotaxis protein
MAHNGKEGVEMAMEEKFDVIIMDVQMPVMDGYEATIAIRNQTNPNQQTSIIALTASALVSEKNKAFDVGMTDYISKPFKPDTLVEKLRFLHEYPTESVVPPKELSFKFNKTLDVAYLNEIYEGDLEYAADMFETFLEVTLVEIYAIEPLIEKEDWQAARTLSHKCKPAFSMVGLTNLFEQMEQMEKRIKTEPDKETILTDFRQIIQQLEQYLPTLKADLSKMMEAV